MLAVDAGFTPAGEGERTIDDATPSAGVGAIDVGATLGRYHLTRRIGMGGVGVVYAARDRELDREVAIKVLRHKSPSGIRAFKREFRALTDLAHPNLVRLHELVAQDEYWFLVMELVEGHDFVTAVRRREQRGNLAAALPGGELLPRGELSPAHVDRLRPLLRQLAQGVAALHDAGRLHRDIKPSNVLVDGDDRVVLLDFGLARELEAATPESGRNMIGTVAYLAPEQLTGALSSPATDWYSVGAVLYQSLTGMLPFEGKTADVLAAKRTRDPQPPSAVAPNVPPDLDELCTSLLCRDPSQRPGSTDVLASLGVRRRRSARESLPNLPYVGRARHLHALHEAFARSRERAVAVHLHGASGMGKSALIARFLGDIAGSALVLSGRCYERESVPYKGLDTLVEGLSRYLEAQPASEVLRVVPRHAEQLARLFPPLRWLAELPALSSEPHTVDSQEQRRQALGALREVLSRVAERRRVVIAIDDLQWADVDAAAVLTDLLRSPEPPRLLALLCYRTADRLTSEALRVLLHETSPVAPGRNQQLHGPGAAAVAEVEVDALSALDAKLLAQSMLTGASDAADALAAAIARESGGNPFFVTELARYVNAHGEIDDASWESAPTLEQVIGARLDRLPEDARKLLELVSVAGRPVDITLAARAAEIADIEARALTPLRAQHLLRTRRSGNSDALEPYHDRIREAVLARLTEVQYGRYHARLAEVLEAAGNADAEALAMHLHRAGDAARATEYTGTAASQADDAFAFDRAARLYELFLDLSGEDDPRRLELRVKLADALANAGRGFAAAETYMAAAEAADETEALALRRRAAEQFLRSGHIDEGMAAVRTVLEATGIRLAKTPTRAISSLLWGRALLRMRGLGFRERTAEQIEAAELQRIDTCYSVIMGLAAVDPIRAMDVQTFHLRRALKAGEPLRVARALAIEAAMISAGGGSTAARCAKLLAIARQLSERITDPQAEAMVHTADGMVAFHLGQWPHGHDRCRKAMEMLRNRCAGAGWELATVQYYYLWSLFQLGRHAEQWALVPQWLREAQERDDRYGETALRMTLAYGYAIMVDDPEAGRREVVECISQWSREGFQVQHAWAMATSIYIELYADNPAGAWEASQRDWQAYRSSHFPRIQQPHVQVLYMRGLAALALAGTLDGKERSEVLHAARKCSRAIRRTHMEWARPYHRALEASLAAYAGDVDRSERELVAAIEGFEAAHMPVYAAAARHRLGTLGSGERGESMARDAAERMRTAGIHSPHKAIGLLVPPVPGTSSGQS